MIDFYFAPTPNGWKIAIALEEMALDYKTHLMQLSAGDQFKPAFLEISPNARMPAIVDHDPASSFGQSAVSVFESGAILLYLGEKTGQFMPTDAPGRKQLTEWLFWQVGNQGPMAGQLSHFVNYAPKDQAEYGRKRYFGEYDRNLGVLENRLEGRDYMIGEGRGAYSIADMIAFPWVFIAKPLSASLEEFPNLTAWRRRIKERPAVQRAINLFKDQQNRGEHTASNNDIMFNQSAASLKQKRQ